MWEESEHGWTVDPMVRKVLIGGAMQCWEVNTEPRCARRSTDTPISLWQGNWSEGGNQVPKMMYKWQAFPFCSNFIFI